MATHEPDNHWVFSGQLQSRFRTLPVQVAMELSVPEGDRFQVTTQDKPLVTGRTSEGSG
jgi:hypothetical protein